MERFRTAVVSCVATISGMKVYLLCVRTCCSDGYSSGGNSFCGKDQPIALQRVKCALRDAVRFEVIDNSTGLYLFNCAMRNLLHIPQRLVPFLFLYR